MLLAARAAGVEHFLDGSYANIKDPMASASAARRHENSAIGKSAIHPNQIATLNRVFMPSAAEVDYYLRVIAGFDAAIARGSAATTVDGKLVDYAMVGMARRVIAWAEGVKN